jgi:hypothetical protein
MYPPARVRRVLGQFDQHIRTKGAGMRYTFAKKDGKEFREKSTNP